MADRRDKAVVTDYSKYVVTPAEVLGRLWRFADFTASDDYFVVKTGADGLDAITFAPGQSALVLARPGHGKSLFLQATCRKLLDQMEDRGSNGVVLYISLEEPSEKLALKIVGMGGMWTDLVRKNTDPEAFRTATASLPSRIARLRIVQFPGIVNGKMASPVTPGVLTSTIEQLVAEYGDRINGVFLDYAQLLRADGVGRGAKVSDHVLEVSHGLVAMKQSLRCPFFIAVQAGRSADSRGDKLPTMYDLQHSSALEQDADAIISIRRPIVDHSTAETSISFANLSFDITPRLCLYRILKARQDPCAGHTGAFHLDPVTVTIGNLAPAEAGIERLPGSPEECREGDPDRW